MANADKTYQPGWGEKREQHSNYESREKYRNRRFGGAVRMRDKQAFIGLLLILIGVALCGLFFLGKIVLDELKYMPMENQETELKVDELRIHKVDEQDALLLGDSLAQAYNVDSLRRTVQIDTRSVYRPPRKEDKWYITQREWQEIWNSLKNWRKSKE